MEESLPAPEFSAYAAALLQRRKDHAKRDPEQQWAQGVIRGRVKYRGLQDEQLEIADLRATLRACRDARGILEAVILAGDSAIIGRMAND